MTRFPAACLAAFLPLAHAATLAAQRPIPLDTVRVDAGSRLIAGTAAVTRSADVIERAAIEALPAGLSGGAGVSLPAALVRTATTASNMFSARYTSGACGSTARADGRAPFSASGGPCAVNEPVVASNA
jgi:hypothetical protein